MREYPQKFFETIRDGSANSADIILSILGAHGSFNSLLDVGCGPGSWMDAAQRVFSMRAECIMGVDGPYSAPMHIDKPARFRYQDLSEPLHLGEKYELLVCVEVAEHLPETRAASLIDEICAASDVVVFGAAVPGQGGTGHVNEQWPGYWLEKFRAHGFDAYDLFRPLIWTDPGVSPWYAQNCFLFVRAQHPLGEAVRASRITTPADWRLRLVHPGILSLAACETAGASRLLRALPHSLSRSLKRRMAAYF